MERDGKMSEAMSLYNSVLGIDPFNRDAADSLWYLRSKPSNIPLETAGPSKRYTTGFF